MRRPTAPPSTSSRRGTPRVPDATGLELLAQELRESQPDGVRDTEHFRGKAALHVDPAAVRATLLFLRAKGFEFLASVHGLDYYPEEPRLGVEECLEHGAIRGRCRVRPRGGGVHHKASRM